MKTSCEERNDWKGECQDMRFTIVPALLALCLAGSIPASADAWSATYGFTGDVMSPPWSYVYQIGSAWDGTFNFNLMTSFDFVYEGVTEKMWVAPGVVEDPDYGVPLVAASNAWARVRVGSCTEGDSVSGKQPGQGFLAFTAPVTGNYVFSGDVLTYGGPDVPIDTTAWIRTQRSGLLWSGQVVWTGTGSVGAAPNTKPTFSFSAQLNAGETVYFGQSITTGSTSFGWSPLYWLVDVVLNETNLAKYVSGQTYPKHTHSSRTTSTRTSWKACDDDLNTYWISELEAWGSTYTYPYAWMAVEFAAPTTFNKIDIYFKPDLYYLPNEFAIDIWDDVKNDYVQVGYGKKADFAPHYVFLFPQSLTSRKVRYRCEVMDAFSSGYHTHSAIAEFKVINSANTAGWATVTGVIRDSNNKPVKNAYPYFHSLAGADSYSNWSNTHYVGTPSDANGVYTVVVDTTTVPPALGGNHLCVYALGQSMTAPDPDPNRYGVTKAFVVPVAGQTVNLDVSLPGPQEAWTTLGDGATGQWLELSRALAGTQWATTPAVMGNPAEPCEYIANWEMVFRLAKQFADGRFEKMYVTVDYLDIGTAGMQLELSSVPEDNLTQYYKFASSKIRKENTGTWRSQTLVFSKGITWDDYWQFTNPTNDGQNYGSFALQNWLSPPYDNYVKRVSVRFAPQPMPETVSLKLGSVGSPGQHPALRCEDNGLHLRLAPTLMPGNTNPSCIVDNVAGTGKSGFKIDKQAGRSSFYLDVDNNYLFDVVSDLYVTVEYFDNAPGYIMLLMPDNVAQCEAGQLIQKEGTGTWQTKTVHFQDVSVNDGLELVYGGGLATGDIQIYDVDETTAIIGGVSVSVSEPGEPYTPVASIAAAKAAGDNARVELPARTVTANFGSFFYIEEPDRTSGIRVNGTTSAVAGQAVIVKGTMTHVNGEATIVADSVSAPTSGSIIKPLGSANKNLHNVGLSTVGLLVRVWGQVVAGAGTNTFQITDGSDATIKVYAPAGYTAPAGGYVVVNGVCGLDSPTEPVIRVDNAANIN
jgi:hypothetical protein